MQVGWVVQVEVGELFVGEAGVDTDAAVVGSSLFR
jgi:hypothetical protein